MSWAIMHKSGKYVKGTDWCYSPPHQRLTLDAPLLYETLTEARLAFQSRRCNKNYSIVWVKVVTEFWEK